MKPAIRLSCMMNLPVTYIFTHDSINIGPDGPTHQPIEQLAMLRSIPNLDVYRPADAKEVVGVWQAILNSNNPSALILSRADVNLQIGTDVMGVLRGAYIVKSEKSDWMALLLLLDQKWTLQFKLATNYLIVTLISELLVCLV